MGVANDPRLFFYDFCGVKCPPLPKVLQLNIVDEAEWDLSGMVDPIRAQRLLRPISPEAIIDQIASEAIDPQLSPGASWQWQQW